MRLTTLQICCEYAPEKNTHGTKKKNPKRKILYRKKKKLKAKLRRLQVYTPNSPAIQKVQDKLSMLQIDLRDQINSELEGQEKKAVSTIKQNPRYFFSYAKRFSKLKSTIGPLINEDNYLEANSQKQSEILQSQYCSSFSNPNSRNIENTLNSLPPGLILQSKISDISFDENDIIEAIDEIDPYSATSHDSIPAKILKYCKEELSVPLTLLWKKSFAEGRIPPNMKRQYITPHHKKGSKTIASHYRPISLTPHEMKTFERLVRDDLVEHLEVNNIINNTQHGFRKGRSCLTQLLHHHDQILQNLNNGFETDVIYLDYAKAFDKVNHKLLIQKLEVYGVEGKLLKWLWDYLNGRYQIVTVDGFHSRSEPVISGVPQTLSVRSCIVYSLYK